MSDMPPKLAEIVDEFTSAPREVVLEMLLEFSDAVPPLPPSLAAHEGMEQVPECQTPFFLKAEVHPDDSVTTYFDCPAEAPTTRAFAGILSEGLAGASTDEVLGVPADSLVARGPEDRQRADEALEVAMGYAGATKASMLQDLEKGVKTEVDVINGGVVERGTEYSVDTPLNARVVELMHAMERGERRPGRNALEELQALED